MDAIMTILPGGGLLHGPGQAAQSPVPAVLAKKETGAVHPGSGRRQHHGYRYSQCPPVLFVCVFLGK